MFFRHHLLLIFFTVAYSSIAFSHADFNTAYEAAQAGNYKQAIALWQPLAEEGDASAQYTLGWMFESGQGVKQNYQRAIFWYMKAAQQGDVAAQYVLAMLYKKGTGITKNSKKAVVWFIKAANQGDAIAQFELGVHFQKGLGIKQDYQQSLYWFQKAAEQGHITSQINLGKLYQSGETVKLDYKKAIKWYEKAAVQNNALGQYHLAHMYEYGSGVKQDLKQAKSFYLQSAQNNYAPSAYKLAEFYELGKGDVIDFKNAIKWYTKAAIKGNSNAQFKLGNLYEMGEGVKKDIRHAITWYIQAANQNHAQAHYQLALIYEQRLQKKSKTQIRKLHYKEVFGHFQKASQLGYLYADTRLAQLYEKGIGTEVNLQKAIELYQKSSDPWAMERYQLLSKQLNCHNNASTELFSVQIACTTRESLRKQIKQQKIIAIDENNNNWSDTYFTGAVIQGSSELQVTYTREGYFVSAKYTFVGRNKPALIGEIKESFINRYGQPDTQIGVESQKAMSFEWIMDDDIHLIVSRSWPDTTTFVYYFLPEKQTLLETQLKQSDDKNFVAPKKEIKARLKPNLF